MIRNRFKILKCTNLVIIAAYIVTYIMAFSAYDDSGTNFDEDSFEYNVLKLMASVGTAFVCAVITNWCIYKKGKILECIICLIGGAVQIPLLNYAIMAAEKLNNSALYYGDEIVGNHAELAVNMSYIIMVLIGAFILLGVFNLIISIKDREVKDMDETESDEAVYIAEPSYHIPVIVVLLATTLICVLYIYFIIYMTIPFMLAFAVPMSILFATEIKEWVEDKKYVGAAVVYIAYMYTVYGAFYRLFSDELHNMAVNYNAVWLVTA